MKKCSLIYFLFILTFAYSQDTIYFDKDWKETTKTKSSFYRPLPLKKYGELVLLKDYYKNGQLQFQGYIYPNDERKYVGDVFWYDENGFDNGFTQNINLSKQKELIYYNTDGSIWKKIKYRDFGEKTEIIIYHNGKELINGKIINGNFTGSFSPNRPNLYYDNPFYKNDESIPPPVSVTAPAISYNDTKKTPNKIYKEVIYWQNGKIAKETINKNYSQEPSKYWDSTGKEIEKSSKENNIDIEFYTKNGFAVQPKSKTETTINENDYLVTKILYGKNGKIINVSKRLNGNRVEEKIYTNGKEIILKYKDDKPFEGSFNDTIGRYNSIYQMKNGQIVGEAIVKDSKTSKIIAKGDYTNGKPSNGTFYNYDENTITISTYKNQKRDGIQQIFTNIWGEEPSEEFEMKNDLINGFRKIYSDENSVLTSEYRNGKPYEGTIVESNIKSIYKNGNLIQKEEFEKYSDHVKIIETYENNLLKTKTYKNFLIKEKPQSFYTGIYQNEKPFDGYFVNKIILNEIPLIDYYEKGELKYQYSFDFVKQLDDYQFYKYDQKSVYKNGEIVDGFEFIDNEDNATLSLIGYKNGKANYLELNLFAMHYFNRFTFDHNGKEILLKDFEKQTSIKLTKKNNETFAEIFDKDDKLILNNQQKEVKEGFPNSTTIYKIENNQLTKENISLETMIPLYEKAHNELNSFLINIYSSIAYNRTIEIDELFDQFVEIFKSNNIQKLYGQESFIEGSNKVLSSLRYNNEGKPDWGIKITDTNKVFSVEFYEDGKITFTKKINSLDQVQETINTLIKKYE